MVLFTSAKINSNKLGRVTLQSKVENKLAPYRTAAIIFTAILDLEPEERQRKLRRLEEENTPSETATTDETNHHLSAILFNHAL